MAKTKLYIFTPPLGDAASIAAPLSAMLASVPVEAVFLQLDAQKGIDAEKILKDLVPLVQSHGAAALIAPPVDLREVARIGADGVHVVLGSGDLKDLAETLKPEKIIGIGGLRTKHETMETGEQEVDYLMFGEPRADGSLMPLDKLVERVEWWSQIFNLPCVAYAPDADAVRPLAQAGADFVALGPWIFAAADPVASLKTALHAVTDKA